MPYVPYRGGTLLIPSGTADSPDQNHPFVIITNKCDANRHLLVNVSTIREGVHFDPACTIEAGSYVVYRLARTDHVDHLGRMVDGWIFKKKQDASAGLLEKICDGVLQS